MKTNPTDDLFLVTNSLEINGVKILDYVQPITSAETCRNQQAAGARVVTELFSMPMRVLDFGGGKYSEAQEYLRSLGAVCEVYDPYNRSHEENVRVLNQKYDLMMCNNASLMVGNSRAIHWCHLSQRQTQLFTHDALRRSASRYV